MLRLLPPTPPSPPTLSQSLPPPPIDTLPYFVLPRCLMSLRHVVAGDCELTRIFMRPSSTSSICVWGNQAFFCLSKVSLPDLLDSRTILVAPNRDDHTSDVGGIWHLVLKMQENIQLACPMHETLQKP